MSSGDFNLLHLRNLKMYKPDGSFPATSSIFTIGADGVPVYTSSIALGSVSASTLSASTLSSNLLTTNDIQLQSTVIALGLSTTSTQTNFSQGSYASSSWLTAKTGLINPRKLGTSSTGQYQLVVSGNTSDLWLSSDSGITWSSLSPASTGLPTLTGAAYWSSGSISANGQYILLGIYGGSLWMSQDSGRTFALTNQPTPDIWLQLNGSLSDSMGSSTATPYGTMAYAPIQRPGYSGQALKLANTAGGTAVNYVRGTWAGSSNFTVSIWVNVQTLSASQIFFSSYSSTCSIYMDNTNKLSCYIPTGGGANGALLGATSYNATANTWYYITLTFQTNGLCSFYVNNVLIGSLTNSQGVGGLTTSQFSLGTYDTSTNTSFNGLIADLRIHNTAISYNPIPLLAPSIWLPFENNTQDLGSQSANSASSTIWCPFDGSYTDSMNVSSVTAPGTAPGYVPANRAGYSGQAVNLANTAGGTATQYLRGTWTPSNPVNFSVSFWFNLQTVNGTQQVLFCTYAGAVILFVNINNNLLLQIPTGSGAGTTTITLTTPVTANTWYYVTATFQTNGTCSFYVNNTLVGTSANSGGVGSFTSSGFFSLGTYDAAVTSAFNGYIDDFRLYNYAITYNPVSIQTVTGSLSYVPGVVGLNAVRLANTAGGTATNYLRGNWAGSPNFSVSFWFNAQSLGSGASPIIWSSYSDGVTIFIENATNKITYTFSNSNSNSNKSELFGPPVTTNTWYHVYVTFQTNGTGSFYVNNILIGSGTNTGGIYSGWTNTGQFGLGTFDFQATNAFNGYIDDFRIYNAAIPFHQLQPQNYRSVALSGNAQYALASAASGWVLGSSDVQKSWSKQAVCVGTQGDLIQPNKTGLAQSQWEQGGVNWVASASSTLAGYPSYGLFDNVYPGGANNQWASLGTYTGGNYTGSVSTTVQGGVGSVLGEWFQLQTSTPLILQSYRYATQEIVNTPKIYYIVGSNDGSTWFPIHYMSMIANPFTGSGKTLASNIIINHTGVQSIIVDVAGAGSTISYPTSTTPYLYFRVIVTSLLSVGTNAVYTEFIPNFAKPSSNNLSLNYSGQYQMVATGPAAGSIMPNQTGLVSSTWSQGGVQWGASESSFTDINSTSQFAFNNNTGTASQTCWKSGLSKYNTTTGAYSASVSTTILGGIGSQSGEWLQIQSSVPIVLQSYTFGCATYIQIPRLYYIVGSMDGSNWYPIQYCNITTTPFTADSQLCSNYVTVNSTGVQTLTAGQAGSVTTTSYSYSTQPFMYFRLITTNIQASNDGLVSLAEWYLNFQNSLSYSSNYGSSWLNTTNTLSNESVALSPSGQISLGTNCVPPLARLTMDGTNVDSQGVLVPATGAGTVTYSSSIKQVGSQSAFFNNTAGSGAANYLNYTVPAVLNTPPALTMACWIYPTAYPTAPYASTPLGFNNGSTTVGAFFYFRPNETGVMFSVNGTGQYVVPIVVGPTLNSWTHLCITFNGAIMTLYVNGVSVSYLPLTLSGRLTLTDGNSMTNLFIGTQQPSGTYAGAFNGYVDDVRLYTQALSAHEVAALYSNPALTQSVGVSNSYLPITGYTKPVLPGATANVVDAKVSQSGQYMVAVTSATTNNVFYSVDSGSTFTALTIGSSPMAACSISNDGSYLTVANSAGTVYTLNKNSNTYTLAIGNGAGQTNQASNAIAIGNGAGQTNQSANSIVLNASGSSLTATNAGFYVSPVADTAGLPMNLLGYGADQQIVKSGVTVLPGDTFASVYSSGAIQATDVFTIVSGPTNSKGVIRFTTADSVNYIQSGKEMIGSSAADLVFTGIYGGPEWMRIKANGNVGIGTANPGAKLHVNGWGHFGDVIDSLHYGDLQVTRAAGVTDNKFHISMIRNGNIVTGLGYIQGTNIFGIFNGNNTTVSSGIFLAQGGNVGIGITNPSAKLHVEGTARFRSGICSGVVTTASLTNNSFAEYTMADITGDGINTTYIITATVIANASFYAYGFAYNWNPTLLSLTQLTNSGITLSIGGGSKLRITNTTGSTYQITACVTAMGISG